MPELPSELTREIISFLPDEKLSRYASVSRQWQLIVEEQTFREFRIKSTELADFAKLIKGNRIAALKFLQYDVQLPTYDKAAWTRYETNVDRQANNEAFTAAIEDLFHLVKSWEANERDRLVASARKGDRPSFGIELLAQSPMDPIWCAPGSEGYDYYTSTGQRLQDYKQYRFRHSYLQLLRLESLPSLFSISSFVCYSAHVRHVRGCSLAKLSMRLPNLEVIRWGLSDNEKTYPTLRQQLREDFARALATLKLPKLRKFFLVYYRNSEDDHACTPAAANHPRTPDTDRLCIALHYLSLSPLIEEIDLKCDIVISSDLFWPTTPGKQPYWASLRSIEIVFNITTPGGGWYFDWGPQWLSTHRVDKLRPSITGTSDCMGESEDEQDLESEIDGLAVRCSNVSGEPHSIKRACGDHPFRRFRFKPNAEKMNVLLVAAGRAAGQMPWLRCMCLRTCQFGLVKRNFKLYYLAPGVDVRLVSEAPNEPNLPRDASGKPRLYLAVGDLYDPSEEVIATWKKSTGRDLVCKVWTP